MPDRARLRSIYIVGVSVATLALLLYLLLRLEVNWRSAGFAWPAVFGVLVALSHIYSLELSRNLEVTTDTAVEFAALLIFPAPIAALLVFLGTAAGELRLKRPNIRTWMFNASAHALSVFFGAQLFYLVSGPNNGQVNLNTPHEGIAVLLAAAGMYLAITLIVALAISIRHDQHIAAVWFSMVRGQGLEHVALFLLGLLMAYTYGVQPWTIALTVLPIAMVYISLRNSLQLRNLTREAVESMVDVIDARDPYTAGHSVRVSDYSTQVAKSLKLDSGQAELVRTAARVHDLGKIEVSDAVLLKPGKLSEDEWNLMKRHPQTGADILSKFPDFAAGTRLVLHHHERYDGKGYPAAMAGESIPLGARIITVCDSFDTMNTDRPYRKALPSDAIVAELRRGSGTQFDPRVVEAMLTILAANPQIFNNHTVSKPESEPRPVPA